MPNESKSKRTLIIMLAIALLVILVGNLLAYTTQTDWGKVKVRDVRFVGTDGMVMSALLYIPKGVTAKNPAPGILAIHGYINSRETQDGFAIEFARRGYVVLAIDQTGHGYSDSPAFMNEFGGIDGLRYLRSLDIVDKDNIGLEGHSMGGWAIINTAKAFPDNYKSMVLSDSGMGSVTSTFPRNMGVILGEWSEYSQAMWGTPVAKDAVKGALLKKSLWNRGRRGGGQIVRLDCGRHRPQILSATHHTSRCSSFTCSHRLCRRLVPVNLTGRQTLTAFQPDLALEGNRQSDRPNRHDIAVLPCRRPATALQFL